MKISIMKEEIKFQCFVVGLTVLLILRDVISIRINPFFLLGYIVCFMAISNYETIFMIIAFIFPLMCGLPGNYIMLISLLILWIKNGTGIKNRQILMLLFLTMWEVFAAFFYEEFSLASMLGYLSTMGVLFQFLFDDLLDCEESDIHLKIVKSYIVGSAVLCAIIIIAVFKNTSGDWLELFSKGWFRFGDTIESSEMVLSLNANNLAYYSIVSLIICVVFVIKRIGFSIVVDAGLIALFVFAGILSLSRSWFIVLAISVGLILICEIKDIKNLLYIVFIIGIFVSLTAFVLHKNPYVLKGIVQRFSNADVFSGNGRTTIFQNYWNKFLTNIRWIIFGTGVTQYRNVMGFSYAIHNGIEQILVCFGMIGSGFFLYGLIHPIINLKKEFKIERIFFVPLVAEILFLQTIQIVNPCMLVLPVPIVVYFLRCGVK